MLLPKQQHDEFSHSHTHVHLKPELFMTFPSQHADALVNAEIDLSALHLLKVHVQSHNNVMLSSSGRVLYIKNHQSHYYLLPKEEYLEELGLPKGPRIKLLVSHENPTSVIVLLPLLPPYTYAMNPLSPSAPPSIRKGSIFSWPSSSPFPGTMTTYFKIYFLF